jgi:hypothetical protein
MWCFLLLLFVAKFEFWEGHNKIMIPDHMLSIITSNSKCSENISTISS